MQKTKQKQVSDAGKRTSRTKLPFLACGRYAIGPYFRRVVVLGFLKNCCVGLHVEGLLICSRL
jgi:hypothetical protein